METQKDYLTSQVPRPLRVQPDAPRNVYDLADKQQQVSIFTRGDDRGLTKTLDVPDTDIPQVNVPAPPRNRFVDKMQNQFDREKTQMEQLEGADSHDDDIKYEQRTRHQPQPGGDQGQSHHGSRKVEVNEQVGSKNWYLKSGGREPARKVEITEADGTTKLMHDQEFIKAVAPTLMSYNTNDALDNYVDKFNQTYAPRQARVVADKTPLARSAMKDTRHNPQRIGRVINYDDGISGPTR